MQHVHEQGHAGQVQQDAHHIHRHELAEIGGVPLLPEDEAAGQKVAVHRARRVAQAAGDEVGHLQQGHEPLVYQELYGGIGRAHAAEEEKLAESGPEFAYERKHDIVPFLDGPSIAQPIPGGQGPRKPEESMRIIRVGMIGTGFMGRTHSYSLINMPLFYPNLPFRVQLAGICCRHAEAAEAARAELGYEYACTDWHDIISDPTIDAVHICTPNGEHEAMVTAALAAGKHVYVDKPLGRSGEETARMARAEAESDLTCQVAFNNRFFPSVMRARQLIDEGTLGDILCFRGHYLHSGNIDPNRPYAWRFSKEAAGGGVILDLGSHLLDMIDCLIGAPEAVQCTTRVLHPRRKDAAGVEHDITAEDYAVMTLRMPGGILGTAEVSKIAAGAQDGIHLEIHGTRGALVLSMDDADTLRFYDATAPESPMGGTRGYTVIHTGGRYEAPGGSFPPGRSATGWLRGHAHCVYTFYDALYRGVPGRPSLADAHRVQLALDAAYASAENNGIWTNLGNIGYCRS